MVPIEETKANGELVAALFFDRVFGEGLRYQVLPILATLSAAGSVMVTDHFCSGMSHVVKPFLRDSDKFPGSCKPRNRETRLPSLLSRPLRI